MTTHTLSPDQYNATEKKIHKLIERAHKKGFTGDLTITGTPVTRKNNGFYPNMPDGMDIIVIQTTIVGTAPCYEGWRFLACVEQLANDPDQPGKTLWNIRIPAGVDNVNIKRSDLRRNTCDHCNTNRYRKTMYIVENTDTHKVKQVGSTCLKDFFGWNTTPVFLDNSDADAEHDSPRGEPAFEPAYLVTLSWIIAQQHGGFKPKSFEYESTAEKVLDYLYGPNNDLMRAVRQKVDDEYEQSRTFVDGTLIPEVTQKLTDDTGDFAANLLDILATPYCNAAKMGLLAATVSVYERMQKDRARHNATPKNRTHIGQEGEKVTATGQITYMQQQEPMVYGATPSWYIVVTNDDHIMTFYSAAKWTYDDAVTIGTTVTIAGTVKKHTYYKDTPETRLARVKKVENP